MDPFLHPSSLKVFDVQDIADRLVVTVQDTREDVCCPSCGQPSRRIHSHSLRVTQDTAVGDRAVEVHLHVRQLRCDTTTCSHLTFAETWPAWLDARVQRTSRLTQVQRSVGLALGGEAGKRPLTGRTKKRGRLPVSAVRRGNQAGCQRFSQALLSANVACRPRNLVRPEFVHLLRHRPQDAAARLKARLVEAKASTFVQLARFAQGIRTDFSAVMGAVTSAWSNGQVEGQVTRVKLLKR